MKIKEKTAEETRITSSASKDLLDTIQGLKTPIYSISLLDSDNWQYDKGSIKVCKKLMS